MMNFRKYFWSASINVTTGIIESEKQFIDALRVYEVQHEKLDMAYLEEWATKLGVESLFERLIAEAEII